MIRQQGVIATLIAVIIAMHWGAFGVGAGTWRSVDRFLCLP